MAGTRSRSRMSGIVVALFAAICMILLTARPRSPSRDLQSNRLGFILLKMPPLQQSQKSRILAKVRSKGCVARNAVGVFFDTSTGNTEGVAERISEASGANEPVNIGEVDVQDLAGLDGLIVGCPTWNTGADEFRSGTAWDDLYEEIRELDLLKGKPVAVFGCGDSQAYGDNYCDGLEELHRNFEATGAKMLGYTDSSGYSHRESKSEKNGKFLGLPLDEDNEFEMTDDRIKAWISQLKEEGMPF